MPKPLYATVDELEAQKKELEGVIDTLRKATATKDELFQSIKNVDNNFKELRDTVGENKASAEAHSNRLEEDLKRYADDAIKQLNAALTAAINGVDNQRATDREEMEANLSAVDRSIRDTMRADLGSLRADLENQLEQQRLNLTNLIEQRASEAEAERNRHRSEIEDLIEKRRQELLAEDGQTRQDTANEFRRTHELMRKLDENQNDKNRQSRSEVDGRMDGIDATADKDRTFASDAIAFVRSEAASCLDQFRQEAERHLSTLDRETSNLWDSFREVQELPTRRIEWIIPNASKALVLPSDGQRDYTSWFSRRFRGGGTRNMRLELRRYRPTNDGSTFTGPSGVGDCAVFLWCGRRMHMHYRLFIGEKGEKTATLEKLFDERCSHGTKKMGYIAELISSADDTLRVGIELLEAICEIDNQSPVLRSGDADEPSANDEDVDDTIDDGDGGSLLFYRHVNHRLLSQMKTEVERMQARMVRRIEWRVEHASMLQNLFHSREAICSPVFGAGGVEGLQLIFYPSGYMGATEGFCSLYLYAPAGVSIRCTLSVGSQTRDAINTYAEAGAYGRANFCMYKGCYDVTHDVVTLAFDIVEISQALNATAYKTSAERMATESHLSMLRVPGRSALTETKVLPALWTSKALSDEQTPPDGYHAYDDLKDQRAGAGGMNPFRPLKTISGNSAKPTSPPNKRSESSPALHRPNVSTGLEQEMTFDLAASGASWGAAVADGTGSLSGTLPMLKTIPSDMAASRRGKKLRAAGSVVSLSGNGDPMPPSSIPPLGTLVQLPAYVPGLT